MKRKITFLLSALFALTLIAQSFSASGQAKTDPTYKLTAVTSVSAGNKYVFVNDGYAITTVSSKVLQSTNSYSSTGLDGDEAYVWELESATNGFYMKNASLNSNQYLNNTNGKTEMTMGSKSDIWSISITNNVALISNTSNSNRFIGDTGGTGNSQAHTYRAYATSNYSSYAHDFTVYILEEESDEPAITVLPTSLNGLSYNHGNGPSTAKSFIASGTNLTEMIVVDAPNHYEISRDNSTFKDTLQLRQHGGTVSGTTIYARLKAGQNVGDYNSENVTLDSDGATQKTVSLSGSVSGYTVTYDCNDGTSNCPDNESNVPSGSYTINTTEPSRTNYSFGGWSDGTTTYDAGDEYTITGNVTFTAQWVPDTYAYAIDITGPDTGATATLSVGGETLDEDDEIDYDAEVTINVNVSSGYGYSIEVLDSDDNEVELDDDNKFTMPASEVYITIITVVDPYSKAKLTSSNMLSMTGDVAYDTEKTVTVNGYTWKTTGYQGTSNQNRMGMIQLRTKNTPYIQLPQLDGKIKEITFKVTGAGNSDSSYENGTATTTGLVFKTSTGGSNIASSESTSSKSRTITMPTGFYNTGYILSDGGIRVWEISITYLPYDNFTDLDPSDPMPATLSAGANVAVPSDMETTNLTIPATAALVVKSGATLTLSGTLTNLGTAANLVIEDGGQLIHTNAVNATLHKEITGYGANPEITTGWYTIASPVNNLNVSLATTDTYDMFIYDEEHYQWKNQKVGANSITAFHEAQGFLYSNSADQTLAYAGSMKATNAEVSIDLSYTAGAGALAGYNLVGNPFSRNLTSGKVKVGGSPITTYYVSEGGSNLTPHAIADYPIKPGQGFFVQATGAGQQIVFNPSSKDYASNNKPTYITIEAGNSNFTDRAYVQLGGGNTLRKMSVNDNVHSLYVMQDGKDYASATIESYNGSIPVCFKATETGRYTINVQTTGIDADYLHLIDRYTGADVDLLTEPSYTFIATKDDYESRFTLVFTADGSDTNNDIFAYQSGSAIIVNGNGELQIFDVMGRMVSTQNVNGTETISVNAQGVYIFRLVGSEIKTQKIVVR